MAKTPALNPIRFRFAHYPAGVYIAGQDNSIGCLEKLEFSFKIKACEKFNRRHMFDIPRIKF